MRTLILLLMFVTTLGYSQNIHFNLTDFQAYKMPILNLANKNQADEISRAIEKNHFAELVWIDYQNNEIFLITYKAIQIQEIISYLNNYYNVSFGDLEELNFNNDIFLNVYAQKSGVNKGNIPNQIPEMIYLGNQEKSDRFYQIAKEIWVNKFPEKYKVIFSAEEKNVEIVPEHYPKFNNTGNPDNDNAVFDQAKKEWIKNYPEEAKQYLGQ